jgi:hypothetical protein
VNRHCDGSRGVWYRAVISVGSRKGTDRKPKGQGDFK